MKPPPGLKSAIHHDYFDAYTLQKEDGKGKWRQDLDPQDLRTGPNMVIPDGITGIMVRSEWQLRLWRMHQWPWLRLIVLSGAR